ncbi:MAG: zinc-binding dehydrogenase [Candidatus Thorarchaeota archaeon]
MFDLQLWKVALKKIGLGGKFLMYKYKDKWPKPKIKYENQVIIKNLLGGICGSDLHQLQVDVSYASSILARKINPFPIGHEAIGLVEEVGSKVTSWKVGDRVVYNPVATCESYEYKLCSSCQTGNFSSCYCLTGLGDKSKLEEKYSESDYGYGGGGFNEYLIGFEKQFYKIPSDLQDEVAILTEPFAIAIHAVGRNLPEDEDTVLIYGAGIIGLLTIAAIRAFGIKARIITLARYKHQAEIAVKLGSNEVIIERNRNELYSKIALLTNGHLFKPTLGKKILFGGNGPDIIFDCVANEKTLDDSLHLVRSNGKIIVVGLGYNKTKTIDWALQAYKELTIVGTMMHRLEKYQDKNWDSFDLAIHFLNTNPNLYSDLVTHKFKIEDFKNAFKLSMRKGQNKVVKSVFDYREINQI